MTSDRRKDTVGSAAQPKSAQVQWARGYFCAVSVLLREEGVVTPAVRSLFEQGGSPLGADPADQELFRAHGMM